MAVVLLTLLLVACGSSSGTGSEDESSGSAEQTETAEKVHPYAWLGLQDMPECEYLDILATNHYIMKSEIYIKDLPTTTEVNTVDGIDTYTEDEYSKVYTINGKTTSINKDSKIYMEYDMSDIAEEAKESTESAIKNGTNLSGMALKRTGKEAVPIYSDQNSSLFSSSFINLVFLLFPLRL